MPPSMPPTRRGWACRGDWLVLHARATVHAEAAAPRTVNDDGIPGENPVAPCPIVSTQPAFSWPRVKGSVNDRDPRSFQQMQIGVTHPHPDLHQYLPGSGLGHRHVPELARLLPFDELEGLDGGASSVIRSNSTSRCSGPRKIWFCR